MDELHCTEGVFLLFPISWPNAQKQTFRTLGHDNFFCLGRILNDEITFSLPNKNAGRIFTLHI